MASASTSSSGAESSSAESGSESNAEACSKRKRSHKLEHGNELKQRKTGSRADAHDKNKQDDDVVVSSHSASSSESESESSSEEERKKKKNEKKGMKKNKKDSKNKKDKKNKKTSKKKQKKDKDKKGKKSKKKDKKQAKASRDAVSNQFGKYGVIKQEDFFMKKAEFLLWAMDVKKINTDGMGQMQQKDLFKDYIEDYNTATMPSKKYYNLQVWEKEQLAKKANKRKDMSDSQRTAFASFDDERARREEITLLRAKKQEEQITDEVRRMRQNKDKVAEMNHQQRLRTQMDMLNKSGHTKEATKIAERLDPSRDDFGRTRK